MAPEAKKKYLVKMTAAPDHTLSTFMDKELTLSGANEFEAIQKFRDYYGILNTVHTITATEVKPEVSAAS